MLQYSLSIKLSWCQRAPKTFCYKILQNTKFIFFTTFGYCGGGVPHIIFCKLPILRLDKLNQSDFSLSAVWGFSLLQQKYFKEKRFYKTCVSFKLQQLSDNGTKSYQESLCLESSNKLPVGFPSLVTCGKR